MRDNKNNVTLAGYVYSFGDGNRKMLEEKVTGEKSKNPGTKYISGVLNVAVDEEGLNVIPVEFTYVTETTKKGEANRTYAALKQIIDGKKTWIENGKEEAPKVKISASIALNDFPNAEGEMISAKYVSGSFVTVVSTLPTKDIERNSFEVDFLITAATHIDKDEEKNIDDHCKIRGAAFAFNNAILPMDFVVRAEEGMNYFESLGVSNAEPCYTKLYGYINCQTVKNVVTENTAWGKPIVKEYERRTREWVVEQSAYEPYEFGEANVMTVEDVQKALQDRQVYLAEVKKRNDDYKATRNTPNAAAATPIVPAKKAGFDF